MPKKGEYNPITERYWRDAVAGWEKSGLSAKVYCEENNILHTGFINWRKRLAQRDAERESEKSREIEFAPVHVIDTGLSAGAQAGFPIVMELVLADGIVVRLSEHCSMKLLASVVTLFGRA
jgi:hypothetical protein